MTSVTLGIDDAAKEVMIDLPSVLAGRLLVMASSGGGKTWLLRRLLEQSFHLIQHAVIDPEGDLSTLADRFAYTVVDASKFAHMGDVARRVREHRLSVIIDISELDREEQAEAVTEFLTGLVGAPKEHWYPMLVAIDEAHLFAPWGDAELSNATRKASVGAMTQLMSRGRKRGLAGVIATQRLAKLAKSVVSEVGNVLLGRCLLDIDTYRAAELLGWNRKRADDLRRLDTGQFWAFGEALTPHPMRVRIGAVETRHAGATPFLVPPPAISPEQALQLLEDGPSVAEDDDQDDDADTDVAEGGNNDNNVGDHAIDRAIEVLSSGRHVVVPLHGGANFLIDGVTTLKASELVERANKMLHRRGLAEIGSTLKIVQEHDQRLQPGSGVDTDVDKGLPIKKRRISPRRDDGWSDDELVTVFVGYAENIPPDELVRRLPRRTDKAVKSVAHQLEIRRPRMWTDERVATLREVYANREMTLVQMAERVGVPVDSMRAKADALGLIRPAAWSDQQVECLRKAAADGKFLKDDELLTQLGHGYRAAVAKAVQLGIKFSKPAGTPAAREVARRRKGRDGSLPARDQILAALREASAPMRPMAIWQVIGRKASAQLHYMHRAREVDVVEIDGRTHYQLPQDVVGSQAIVVTEQEENGEIGPHDDEELPSEDDGGEVPACYPNSSVYSRRQYIAVFRGYRANKPTRQIARVAGLTPDQVQICITGLIRCGALQRKSWAMDEAVDERPPIRDIDTRDGLAVPSAPQPAVSEALVKGQRRLWRKVIVQALFDAFGRIQSIDYGSKEVQRRVLVDQARGWFIDGGRDFHGVCGLAAWEPDWVRRKALQLFALFDGLDPSAREAFVRGFGNVELDDGVSTKRRPVVLSSRPTKRVGAKPPKVVERVRQREEAMHV